MPFQQLHYTSCETGLSGYSGFQFCAMTPGVSKGIMREVERLTVYESPRILPQSVPTPEVATYPANLLYTYSDHTEAVIIARVIFTGVDFSNRSGNYFAHTLVTGSPVDDFRSVLPVEFWDAPFWEAGRVDGSDLPLLPGPPSQGPITRDAISEYLADEPAEHTDLASLVAAVYGAMNGGRPVLLIGSDSTVVARWIAAVSYLLGTSLARKLTFSTYSHDPRRCRTHVVGTVAAAGPFRADVTSSFWVFDLIRADPEDAPGSLPASLLARLGVSASGRLWELAASLGAPVEASLEGWFPILANAALLLEQPLTPIELDAAIAWLASNGSDSAADWTDAVVRSALSQPMEWLPVQRQTELVDLAVKVDSMPTGAPAGLAGQVERALVAGMLSRGDAGDLPRDVISLRTERARKVASDGCVQRLPDANAVQVVELLAWASAVGARLPEDVVWQTGQAVTAGLAEDGMPPGLDQAAKEWPALRGGLVDSLARLPAKPQQVILAGPAARVFRSTDFLGHPQLGEEWLVLAAHHRRVTCATALQQIVGLRQSHNLPDPSIDQQLLLRLWPNRGWTPGEAIELIEKLPLGELATEPMRQRFISVLHNFPADVEADSWMAFVGKLVGLPSGVLPEQTQNLILELSNTINLIRQTPAVGEPAEAAIIELLAIYSESGREVQVFLQWQLPSLLLPQTGLSRLLRSCPPPLFNRFCEYAREQLDSNPGNVALAAKLFVAMQELKDLRRPLQATYLEQHVLAPVLPGWKRRELDAVGAEADRLSLNASQYFGVWRSKYARRRIGRRYGSDKSK